MSGKSALLLGSTGQVGQHLLLELLASPAFTRVGEYGRRVTDPARLAVGTEKLEQKTVDFEKLGQAGMRDGEWDVVFITLGTTRKNAGSAEAFVKIDSEYVINAAREAKSMNPAHKQRLVYCSAGGANPTSSFLYPRTKGQTELALAHLGYADTIVFRPGLLTGVARPETRLVEAAAIGLLGWSMAWTDRLGISVQNLAKSMLRAGIVGSEGIPPAVGESADGFTAIANPGCVALASG